MRRAVFFDRDGVLVITVDGIAPRTLDEFRVYPDASSAVWRLKKAGFVTVVATNQPDVERGLITRETLERMHFEMRRRIMNIDYIETCEHTAERECQCRKPKPGLLIHAAFKLGINTNNSFMVGDRWSDIAAGRAVGCKTILIERFTPEEMNGETPDYTVRTVGQAADLILSLEAQKNAASRQRLESQNFR